MFVDSDVEEPASSSSADAAPGSAKRKHSDVDSRETSVKRPRTEQTADPTAEEEEDEVIELD